MDLLQIVLMIAGVIIAGAGVVLLVRSRRETGASNLRPYVPVATLVVGLAIAYRAIFDYRLLDGQDVTIMFLFVLGLITLLGLQFFIVEKNKLEPGSPTEKGPVRSQPPDNDEEPLNV